MNACSPSIWFSIGNILQSPVVSPGAGEKFHPRIYCHMADRQQDRFSPQPTGLRAGKQHRSSFNSNSWQLHIHIFCFRAIIQEGRSLASDRGLYFTETSALLGDHVSQLLEDVGRYPASWKL